MGFDLDRISVDPRMVEMWLEGMSRRTGTRYNLRDPLYDYLKAFTAGVEPVFQPEHNQYRWSDIGKSPYYDLFIDHETGGRKMPSLQEMLQVGR